MNLHEVDILLGVFIAAGSFCLYEELGIAPWTPWHTVSWWASRHAAIRWLVILLFLSGGIIGAVWFHGHACFGCVAK